jgi:hypothetical protein
MEYVKLIPATVSIFIFVNKGIRIEAGVDIPQLPAKPRPSEVVVQ